MANLVIDYLEESVKKYPDKIAYIDRKNKITFSDLRSQAFCIATELIEEGIFKKTSISIFGKKCFLHSCVYGRSI